MIKQRTLKEAISTTGVGLHKGNKVNLTLRPAAPNYGYCIPSCRSRSCSRDKSSPELVRDTRMCTCLINDENVRVSTVEHLLAAKSLPWA